MATQHKAQDPTEAALSAIEAALNLPQAQNDAVKSTAKLPEIKSGELSTGFVRQIEASSSPQAPQPRY